jgi:hypothetical protein
MCWVFLSPGFLLSITSLPLLSKVKVTLWPTVSRPVCPDIRPLSGTRDQLSSFHRNYLQIHAGFSYHGSAICTYKCYCALSALSLSKFRSYLTLSFETEFPCCRLLRLAGLRLWYSSPPPHGVTSVGRPVCTDTKSPSGTREQFFILFHGIYLHTVEVFFPYYGASSLTRGRICRFFRDCTS